MLFIHCLSLSNSPVPVLINVNHLVSKFKMSSPFYVPYVVEMECSGHIDYNIYCVK